MWQQGLLLSQLLKLNGASNLVLAANAGMKMDIAKDIGAAYVSALSRSYSLLTMLRVQRHLH